MPGEYLIDDNGAYLVDDEGNYLYAGDEAPEGDPGVTNPRPPYRPPMRPVSTTISRSLGQPL